MKNTLNEYIKKFQEKHRNYRRYAIVFSVLAIITVLGVNWGLHQTGVSMTGNYICGYEEHQHTDACYEDILICTQEEGEEHQHTEACYEKQLVCQIPEHVHTEACMAKNANDGNDTVAVQAETDGALDMSAQLTGMSGEGTKYDEKGNLYSTKLRIDFTFDEEAVQRDGLNYYYEYPEGIIIPDGLLNQKKDLYDADGKKAGVYYFEKTEDGRYRVGIDFDEDYIDAAQKDISGYIQFAGEVDGSKADDDGNIKIAGSDKVTLDIPADQITYPDGVTNRYEIKTSKKGNYEVKNGKLVYTVDVYSLKGTPSDIDFKDTITASGLTLGNPSVEVTQETVKRYYNPDNGNWDPNGSVADSKKLDVAYTYENGKLTMTLPQINPATHVDKSDTEWEYDQYTRYTVKYTFDVTDIPDDTVSVNNTVDTVSSNNKTTVKAEASSKVDVSAGTDTDSIIEKSGVGGAEGVDYITWTITVNKDNQNIAGAKLRDDMLSKLIPGHFTVNPDNGYELVKDDNGNVIGMDFKEVANGENTNKYTITYRAPAQKEWDKDAATNTATFTPAGSDTSEDAKADVKLDGTWIGKTMDGAEDIEEGKSVAVSWTVKIIAPTDKMPAGTVIKDDPTKDRWDKASGKQYLTRDQVRTWASGIYWADSSGAKINGPDLTDSSIAEVKFLASDGNEYTLQDIEKSTDDDLTYTVCTITLKQDVATPANGVYLMFKYVTTADVSDAVAGSNDYKNTISVNDKKIDATYTYNKSGVTKTDENNNTDTTQKTNADGTLTWKIKVNTTKDTNTLTITDKLPNGVTLKTLAGEGSMANLSAEISGENVTGTMGDGYTVSGSYKDNKLELTITGNNGNNLLKSGVYTLVVTCKVDKDAIDGYEAGKPYTFKNEASASDDKGKIGSADQTQEWTEDTESNKTKVVDKSGKWDNDSRRVKYSIKLNPDGEDIVKGSEVLTLQDEFTYYSIIDGKTYDDWLHGTGTAERFNVNAWLVPGSVKLYKGVPDGNGGLTKGEEITNWSWTVETSKDEYPDGLGAYHLHSMLIGKNLPDSTPMILEYDYQIQTDMPADWHSVGSLGVSNKAELKGTGYKDDKTQGDVEWAKQESTGEVTTDIRGVLYKVCEGNYGKTLPGAKFKLQKYDVQNNKYVDTDVTYTTDSDGKIVIQWQKSDSDTQYEHNVLYRIVETEAPEGYKMPSDPEGNAFCFYFKSTTDTVNALPWNLTTLAPNAADLSASSSVFYVENKSDSTELTVNKQWLDQDGNVETGHTGSIKVNLYQIATTTPTSGGGDAKLKGQITYWTNTWQTFNEEYTSGTKISFIITKNKYLTGTPVIEINGQKIEPADTTDVGNDTRYTYTFVLESGTNTISGQLPEIGTLDNYGFLGITAEEPSDGGGDDSDTDTSTSTYLGTFEIKSDDDWSTTITTETGLSIDVKGMNWSTILSGLPTKGKNDAGEIVYYTYKVEEVGNRNYDVSYDNNGVSEGTITVKNQMSEHPSYELPKTGGAGTKWFTTVGTILMAATLLYGYFVRVRRKRR